MRIMCNKMLGVWNIKLLGFMIITDFQVAQSKVCVKPSGQIQSTQDAPTGP